jgi:hypothetical protein
MTNTIAPVRAKVSVINLTNVTLEVKNNRLADAGPNKGKWALHKKAILKPKECEVFELLQGDSSQLMVYGSTDTTSQRFLYEIEGFDLQDEQTVQLFPDGFEITSELLCRA